MVRSEHVIVYRTDQSSDRKKSVLFLDRWLQAPLVGQLIHQRAPLLPQDLRAGQAAVAADHNQSVDALEKQIAYRLFSPFPFQKTRASGRPQ